GSQVNATVDVANQNATRLDQMKRAVDVTPDAPKTLRERTVSYQKQINDILNTLRGEFALGSKSDAPPQPIQGRVGTVGGSYFQFLGRPTGMMQEQLSIASELFTSELAKLKKLVETDIPALEKDLEKAGAPYTSGRLPGNR